MAKDMNLMREKNGSWIETALVCMFMCVFDKRKKERKGRLRRKNRRRQRERGGEIRLEISNKGR